MKSYHNISKKSQKNLLVGLFYKYSSAVRAHHKLLASGYFQNDINIVMTTETWKKYFLNSFENEHNNDQATYSINAQNRELLPCENAFEISDLLSRACILPGFDVLVAGPLGQLLSSPSGMGYYAGMTGTFQKWGLPMALSIQFEEVIFCGGIMLGVRVEPGKNNSSIASHWTGYQGTHVHLL